MTSHVTLGGNLRHCCGMDKAEHGRRLAAAMGSQRKGRQEVADWAGVKVRTVTNWSTGATMPSAPERDALRRLLGPYDVEGDAVEVAVRSSDLIEWRQDAVLSVYKRHMHEQAEGATG